LARIGVDRVMWSTDFPHNESTYGYSNESLASVVDAVGPDATAAIASGNVKREPVLTPSPATSGQGAH
jgi:predicted TIM-barrel fold metal-dependent hydrolase